MTPVRILKWKSDSFGEFYYDVSTNELLDAAALDILQMRLELEIITPPRPLHREPLMSHFTQRRNTLLIALNGNMEDEAFDSMREELIRVNRDIEKIEMRRRAQQEEYDQAVLAVEKEDGAKALEIITNRASEDIEEDLETITPSRCAKVKQ